MQRVMRVIRVGLVGFALLLAACSSTSLSGSWKNPDFSGRVNKIYLIGIAERETGRRIFEDRFSSILATYGVIGIPSYHDLQLDQETNRQLIADKVKANGADSVLLARIIDQRTEEVVNPGQISTPGFGPRYLSPGGYLPAPYYRNYGDYYNYSRRFTYQPATVTEYKIATIEANLYQAGNSELIWSAQLETVLDGDLGKLITDFVKVVTEDLNAKGLI